MKPTAPPHADARSACAADDEMAALPTDDEEEAAAPDSTDTDDDTPASGAAETSDAAKPPRPAPGQRPALEFTFKGRSARRPPRAPRAPFVIALLGDVSGRASRGMVEPVAGRTPFSVDRVSFDEVLAR